MQRKFAVVRPNVALPQNQPACVLTTPVNLLDCGNWAQSAIWVVPSDAVSGIYFADVLDSGPIGASHVFFVVRDDASMLRRLVPDLGHHLAGVQHLRREKPLRRRRSRPCQEGQLQPPVRHADVDSGESWVFSAEYPMVRWLEANGYDVSYQTGVDSDRNWGAIFRHKVFLSSGHDEYWSAPQRISAEGAITTGVNLAFFSGNESFYKTRWENNYRTLVCYKESTTKTDPSTAWTGLWRDPRFSPPSDGGRPENALTGTLTGLITTGSITVPEADGKMRLWRDTSIAQLAPGDTATLPYGTLGYEWDEDVDNGVGGEDAFWGVTPTGNAFRPAGLIRLSTTTVNLQSQPLAGNPDLQGTPFASLNALAQTPTVATHHLTMYRAPSGALVFSTGTVQWAWGLDGHHDGTPTTADPRMQQATVNLLADMGVQPATLQAGMVAATRSTDTTAPSSSAGAPNSPSPTNP